MTRETNYYIVTGGNDYYWETILTYAESAEQAMAIVDSEYDSFKYFDRAVAQLEARIKRKINVNDERDFSLLHDYLYRAASAECVDHDDPRIKYATLWNVLDNGITCLHWDYGK